VASLGSRKLEYVLIAMTGALLACGSPQDSVKSPGVHQETHEKPSPVAVARTGVRFDFYLLALTVFSLTTRPARPTGG